MTDATSAERGDAPLTLTRLSDLGAMLKRSDIGLAVGIMAILVVLILPLPSILLDFALAISITFSVLILMTSLFIQAPLEFSAVFPTVLLIATMLRLALNVASTRLILAHGHEDGTAAAGHVIQAFGEFVAGGSSSSAFTIFAILIAIQFLGHHQGRHRISEVAARFALGSACRASRWRSTPTLNAGLITQEMRGAGEEVRRTADFYGAMDGASKFVRGDAIAGLLVVLINVIGGMVIGIMQQSLSFADAAHTYTLLTVGDGLVTQIPALIVSIAAGLLVSNNSH